LSKHNGNHLPQKGHIIGWIKLLVLLKIDWKMTRDISEGKWPLNLWFMMMQLHSGQAVSTRVMEWWEGNGLGPSYWHERDAP